MKFTASAFTSALIASGLFLAVSATGTVEKCVLDDSMFADDWPQGYCSAGEFLKTLTCQGNTCPGPIGSFWGSNNVMDNMEVFAPIWCIDLDRNIGLGKHCFDAISSYQDFRTDAIDDETMLPNVNYLLNTYREFSTSDCGSATLTWSDVQDAIWDLVEVDFDISDKSCLAKKLAWDARENGNGFNPCTAGLENPIFGVILIVDAFNGNIQNQVLIEEVPATCVPCDDDDPCTNDYCDEYGNCYHEKIENCCVDDDDCKWCKCLKKDKYDPTGICKPDPCMWGEWNNYKSECDCMGSQQCWDGFCKKGWAYDKFLGRIQICDTPKLPADGALIEGFGLCCLCKGEEPPCNDPTNPDCINYDPDYVEPMGYMCHECMPGKCEQYWGPGFSTQCYDQYPNGGCPSGTDLCGGTGGSDRKLRAA